MPIRDLLLVELETETKKTRTVLERIPGDRSEFTPHTKSMPFGKLAAHITDLLGFGLTVVTTPELDFTLGSVRPTKFESGGQLARLLEERTAALRAVMQGMEDATWSDPWKLSFGGKTLFEGTRFQAYREMFMNHHVHHRGQLSVYLRLNGVAVPWLFGPTADEPFTG